MTMNTPSLVHETTATTGTGDYTLGGAASADVRTFASAITAGASAYVPYVCRSRTGTDYEIGIGTLTANTTLARTAVIRSSNANAAVNWGAGTKDIYVGNGGAAAIGRHVQVDSAAISYTARPDPPASYGPPEGYTFGSMFAMLTGGSGDAFASNGVGLWIMTGAPADGSYGCWAFLPPSLYPVYRDDATGTIRNATCIGAYAEAADTAAAAGATVVGESAHVENPATLVEGGPWNDGATPGESQGGSRLQAVRTTDATPVECGYYDAIFLLGVKQASLVRVQAVAFDNATPDAKAWTIDALLYRQDSGSAVLVGSITKTAVAATAGAAAWDVDLTASGNGLSVTVTGAAAKTIQWSARVHATQAAVIA